MNEPLGPCVQDLCTADAVAYVWRTAGPSARLTVVIGPRAVELADGIDTSALNVMCADHAREELDDYLGALGGSR
jgi:hypothetical protein